MHNYRYPSVHQNLIRAPQDQQNLWLSIVLPSLARTDSTQLNFCHLPSSGQPNVAIHSNWKNLLLQFGVSESSVLPNSQCCQQQPWHELKSHSSWYCKMARPVLSWFRNCASKEPSRRQVSATVKHQGIGPTLSSVVFKPLCGIPLYWMVLCLDFRMDCDHPQEKLAIIIV